MVVGVFLSTYEIKPFLCVSGVCTPAILKGGQY